MNSGVLGRLGLLLVVWCLFTPVYGIGEEGSADPAFQSADTTEEGSFTEEYSNTEEISDVDVAIDMPAAVVPAVVEQLGVENPQEHQRMKAFCENVGIPAGTVLFASYLMFMFIGLPIIVVSSLSSTTPQMTTPQFCPDICKTSQGYYASIVNGFTNGQYAYVYCNGTTDGSPKKRGISTPAVIYFVLANRRSSTQKPRQVYKDGLICEEVVINATLETLLDMTSAPTKESSNSTPPTLVDMPETPKGE